MALLGNLKKKPLNVYDIVRYKPLYEYYLLNSRGTSITIDSTDDNIVTNPILTDTIIDDSIARDSLSRQPIISEKKLPIDTSKQRDKDDIEDYELIEIRKKKNKNKKSSSDKLE